MTPPQTIVDWPAVLVNISMLIGETRANGMRTAASTVALANYLGHPRSTVRGWLEGSEPRYDEGVRIVAAWVDLTGKAKEFLPRVRRTPTPGMLRE